MKVRFQTDADFNQHIVRAVRRREPAIDFQTAHDARLHGADDETVLARAAEEGRPVVSHDYRTMPRHFATFVTTRTSTGVLMVSQAIPPERCRGRSALDLGSLRSRGVDQSL